MKMKEKENEEKDEFQGCKCRAYGVNGVGKQTNSSHDSKKYSVIMKMDDGKGIGRRVNQNPHHPKEFRQRRQGKGSPCWNCFAINPFLPTQIRDKGN